MFVSFVSMDGGSLVLCDRRSCHKAYHPACIKRDESFFQVKARWTCDTIKVSSPYNVGVKTTDVMLEVLNLDKKEVVSIDTISNQDFSQDECRHLKQSIECGLVKRFTVGEIQETALALQSVKLNDCLEAEFRRLNHLHDGESENGREKEYLFR